MMYRTKAWGMGHWGIERLEGRQLLAGHPWTPAALLIGQDKAVENYPQLTGAGEAVVIIDSGVDYKHPALGGGFGPDYKVEAGWDFIRNDGDPMPDTFAHGTGTAGVVAADSFSFGGYHGQGIAPDVKLIALRQQDSYGVKAALDWTLANIKKYNIVAVNLTDYHGPWGTIYQQEIKNLAAAGVFVSHPSGNGGPDAKMAVQLDAADFSVGSVNWSGQISSFTQRGPYLDLLAPGENVMLPWFNIVTREHVYSSSADGTSWASPVAVGAAALIKQINPRFSPAQIMGILQDSGVPTYDAVSKRTYKRIDLNAALGLAYKRAGEAPATPQPPLSNGPVVVPPVKTPAQSAQSPFSGKRISVAREAIIQAEDFDNGGEGVAYHDTDAANLGKNNYRSAGVDIELWKNGVRDVAEMKAGEWIEYSINVATAGTYDLSARVAARGAGGKFHVEVDGVNKTGTLAAPDTKAWGTFTTLTKRGVALSAGNHILRFKADTAGASGYVANLDWLKLTATSAAPASTAGVQINALKYSAQGGIKHDGKAISYLDQGDWVAYKGVDLGAGVSTLTFNIAVAKGMAGKKIQIRLGSKTGQVIGTLITSATGSWATFKPQSVSITPIAGKQDIYLTFTGGSGVGNIQWMKFA